MWSSSFRHSVHDADSDSDSDVDGDNKGVSDPVLEMDLSARHETVEYRPNPWSIARINAACRPPRREPAPAPAPAKSPPKPQPKPIVEAFKRQANRAVCDAKIIPNPDKSYATTMIPGPSLTHKPRQGSETLRTLAPTRPQISDVPCSVPANVVATPEKRRPAHISANAPPLLDFRQPFSTHTATRSSPAVSQRTHVGNVVRNSKFRHSSPPHAQVSAHTTRPPVSAPNPPTIGPQEQHHGQKTVPRWLLTALHKGLDAPPPPPPEPQIHPDPPHIRTPEPTRRCLSRDPSPPPPPKKPRTASRSDAFLASPSKRSPSAYAFGNDADEAWSTKQGTKRGIALANRGKRSGVHQSGRFRLPIAGFARGMNLPPAKPRVITYLPPPKAMGGSTVSTDEVAARTNLGVEEDVEARVMDSDVTLVNEDEDVVVDVDVDDVCARYPDTRACMKAESRVRKVLGCIVEVRM